MDDLTLQQIVDNLYKDYLKIVEKVGIVKDEIWEKSDFDYHLRLFESKIKGVYTSLRREGLDWIPYEFNLCLHEYGSEDELLFIDIMVDMSDIDFDSDGWLVGYASTYSIMYNDDSLRELFDNNESEEDKINRLLYGDPEDDEDDDKPWLR